MVARRKGTTRRNRTLAGLDFIGVFAMQHGHWLNDAYIKMTEDEMLQLYQENRGVFAALRDPKEKKTRDDYLGHYPGRRSWCWWQVDSPEPRNDELPEVEQLDRLGLLADEELAMLERDVNWPPPNEYSANLFDRPWAWWRFKSPDLRDWTVSEPVQLVTMGRKFLTERECEFLITGTDYKNNTAEEFFTTEEIARFRIPVPAAA